MGNDEFLPALTWQEWCAMEYNISNRQIFKGDNVTVGNVFKIFYDWLFDGRYSVDIYAFILMEDGKIISDNHMVFWGSNKRLKVRNTGATNELAHPVKMLSSDDFREPEFESRPTDPEMSIIGSIEFRTCAVPFDYHIDMTAWDIDLSKIHPDAHEVVFYASLSDMSCREVNFTDTRFNVAFFYPSQKGLNIEYLFIPDDDYGSCRAIEICRLHKSSHGWEILATGTGFNDLNEIKEKYLDLNEE